MHLQAAVERLRRLRPVALHRPRDDGHALRRPTSRCTPATPVDHDFLVAAGRATSGDDRPDGQRVLPLGVQLLRDAGPRTATVFPIDYANACPDVAITSLHYYFPWAMKALVRWSVFCCATGRQARIVATCRPVVRDRATGTT